MKGLYGWKESKMEENFLSIGSTNRENVLRIYAFTVLIMEVHNIIATNGEDIKLTHWLKRRNLRWRKKGKKEVVSLNISIDNSNKTIKIIFIDKKNHK